MKDYEPRMTFEAQASATFHDKRGDEDACVACLAELAGDGPALELGVGTGRIAFPLAATGIRVDGIDFSPTMVNLLRSKPGGEDMHIVVGDFADFEMNETYSLIYVVWNSFFNLLTQAEQVRCFKKVAQHLQPGGRFLLECFTPDYLFRDVQPAIEIEDVGVDAVQLGVIRHDPSQQRLEQSHVRIGVDGNQVTPVVQRYVWPSEMDLMGQMAGLELVERWADWHGNPHQSGSERHVSVYEMLR